ncbi:MAG: matrixin family metalloprotease [bacterium]
MSDSELQPVRSASPGRFALVRSVAARWRWVALAAVAVGAVWWWFDGNVCGLPVEYRVGHFDERFGISRQELADALHEAESRWEESTGQELFREDQSDSSAVAVNLVFDDRQLATQELDRLREERQRLESELGTITNEYQQLKAAYDERAWTIAGLKADYEERLRLFELTVRAWNARGGAPRDTYDELRREQERLDQFVGELDALVEEQNRLADRLNGLAGREQDRVSSFNTGVSRFNEAFAVDESNDEQGVYGSGTINVYQFDDREDLVMLLTHELGHALGLGHDDDPQSVMYPRKNERQSGGTSYIPSSSLEELFRRCNL